jgi:hypothetical protein
MSVTRLASRRAGDDPLRPICATASLACTRAILGAMTPSEFAARWKGVPATEHAASRSRVIDLCQILGVGAPLDMDPTGDVR